MANLIKQYTLTFQKTTENLFTQEELKNNLSRWINDSATVGFGWGHFSSKVTNSKLISGTRIQIDSTFHFIYLIKDQGISLGSVKLFTNPPLGKINHVYGTQIDNLGLQITSLPLTDTYNGASFVDFLYGSGKDGNLVVNNSKIVNSYLNIVGRFDGGSSNIIVSSPPTEFLIGDEILIVQTQYPDSHRYGLYEFNKIKNIDGNVIFLERNLGYPFISDLINASKYARSCQIIRVPHFRNVTINSQGVILAKPWDGSTGGFIVFRVQETLVNYGTIDASGCGFRGGKPKTIVGSNGYDPLVQYISSQAGEGPYGGSWGYHDTPDVERYVASYVDLITTGYAGAGSCGGGGAGTFNYSCPPSGGGFGTAGGAGYHYKVNEYGVELSTRPGGGQILNQNLSQLTLAPGGASGYDFGHPGSSGGGCIIITANQFNNYGNVVSNGVTNSTFGGCGAGGGILLYSETGQNTGNITAQGGKGYHYNSLKYNYQFNTYFGMVLDFGDGGLGRVSLGTPFSNNVITGTLRTPSTVQEFVQIGKLPLDFSLPTGIWYFVKTTNSSSINIDYISRLDSINVEDFYPYVVEGSEFRFALSFDNQRTWKSWNGSSWNNILPNQLVEFGMTVSLLESLTAKEFFLPNGYTRDYHHLDFLIGIKTGHKYESPRISTILITASERSWRVFAVPIIKSLNQTDINKVQSFIQLL